MLMQFRGLCDPNQVGEMTEMHGLVSSLTRGVFVFLHEHEMVDCVALLLSALSDFFLFNVFCFGFRTFKCVEIGRNDFVSAEFGALYCRIPILLERL